MKQASRGITIVELLIVIAIVALLSATSIPASSAMMARSYLRDSRDELISSLFTAKISALTKKEDSRWGVRTTGNQIILFKGVDYSSRDTDFDQTFVLADSININTVEVVFQRNTANVDTPPTFTISNNIGDSYTIIINQVGNINVN